MGNKVHTPAFSYEAVCAALSAEELGQLKVKFKQLCNNDRGGGGGILDIETFVANKSSIVCPYLRNKFLPRLFYLMSGGSDVSTLKFEEYVGTLALFRFGTQEDKLKYIFMMYEPVKGALNKEKFENMLIDANVIINNDLMYNTKDLTTWIESLSDLISLLIVNTYVQFSTNRDKLVFSDFHSYILQQYQPPEDMVPFILRVLEI